MNKLLYLVGQWFVRALPIRISYALACLLADIQCAISHKDRLAVIGNLTAALGRSPSRLEVRLVFHNFAKYLVDFLLMTKRVDHDFIKSSVTVNGVEYVHEVLNYGKGCIFVSAHLGNWEMGGAVFPLLGYPVSVVALPHINKGVNDFFNAQRAKFGCEVISTNVAVRRVIECLRANKFVAILAERDFGHHGLTMNYLGHQAVIPKGAAVFSIKTGAPIVPAFFLRNDDGTYVIDISKPIYPEVVSMASVTDEQLRQYIQRYLTVIEQYTKKYPTQWLMFRDFRES